MNFFAEDRKFLCQDLTQTRELAQACARSIAVDARLILLFDGEMGAGKTQFIRFLLEALPPATSRGLPPTPDGTSQILSQVMPNVTSPSFAIHNSYESAVGAIEHIDLYRLETEDDLESTGFWDLFLNKTGVVLIEWGVRLGDLNLLGQLPRTWPKFQFEFRILSEVAREVTLTRL